MEKSKQSSKEFAQDSSDLPDYLTDSDIRTLLGAADSPRDRAILTTILTTGIFLAELIALKLDNLDLTASLLRITGKRQREIPLSSPAIAALKDWLNVRPKTPDRTLFVTERGIPKPLSTRSIAHIILTTVKAANLNHTTNYHTLRNTFIIRLLHKTNDPKAATVLLGVEPEALGRFLNHQTPEIQSPKPEDSASYASAQVDDETAFDTRSVLGKLTDVVTHAIHHSDNDLPLSVQTELEGKPIPHNPDEFITFGREKLLQKTTQLLRDNQCVLFTGPPGIGKTHLLKALVDTIPGTIWISSPTPLKTMLLTLAKTLCPNAHLTQRTPTPEIVETILAADILTKPILIIDNFDRLKASDDDTLMRLVDTFPTVAALEDIPKRLKTLCWKFQTIQVEPLDEQSTQQLIIHLTQGHSMNKDDYALLETKVLNLASGNPFAVVELIAQLPVTHKVNAETIRQIDHEAGLIYRDWTWIIMVLWGLLVLSRFVALGTHSFEGYILAGAGISVFTIFKYFLRLRK